MAEFENLQDEQPIVTASGGAQPLAKWALLKDGVIHAIVATRDFLQHPFGRLEQGELNVQHGPVPLTGEHAIRVDGTDAQVGHFVDSKGNVTPSEGRTQTLRPGEPAYHAGPGPVADHVGDGTGVRAEEDPVPAVDAAHDDALEHGGDKPAPDNAG